MSGPGTYNQVEQLKMDPLTGLVSNAGSAVFGVAAAGAGSNIVLARANVKRRLDVRSFLVVDASGYVDAEQAEIAALLENIADCSNKLDQAMQEIRVQRDRLLKSQQQLRETFNRIKNERSIPFFEQYQVPLRIPPQMAVLTDREVEVLRLIAEGLSTRELAKRLGIAFKTAACHRSHILQKLKCHESASLVRLAVSAGLVA